MSTCETNMIRPSATERLHPQFIPSRSVSPRLFLVSEHELHDLRHKLARGQVPTDLEIKLVRLAQGDLAQRSIEQHCRTIVALLQAANTGAFRQATCEDYERLLRVLAYVRKDDDAIPDYRFDGFTDDQQEIRAATRQYDGLLQKFKAWKLRNQVPAMWAINNSD